MEIARGYAVFANGGYLIEPYFVARVENRDGQIVRYANRTKKVTLASSPRRTASHKKGGRLPPLSIVFGQRSVGFDQLQ